MRNKKTICAILMGGVIAGSICTSNIEAHAYTNESSMDFNADGIIDVIDLAILAENYNVDNSNIKWNAVYDLNADNIVDIYDIVKVSKEISTTVLNYNTEITAKFIDANFKNAVYNLIGKKSPEPILYSDVRNIKELGVSNKNISNLSGVEYFTALTKLDCYGNQLTSLDIGNNTLLNCLECGSNKITSLDVSKNTLLNTLDCSSNKLISLDVSKNTSLTELFCIVNQLTGLDVSKNVKLTKLDCYSNQLTSLDLTNNIALTDLDCSWNKLGNLDLNQNTLLYTLDCGGNQLTTLDISENRSLTKFECEYNQLKTLYSFKIWVDDSYKIQYIDANHSSITNRLNITLKNPINE